MIAGGGDGDGNGGGGDGRRDDDGVWTLFFFGFHNELNRYLCALNDFRFSTIKRAVKVTIISDLILFDFCAKKKNNSPSKQTLLSKRS